MLAYKNGIRCSTFVSRRGRGFVVMWLTARAVMVNPAREKLGATCCGLLIWWVYNQQLLEMSQRFYIDNVALEFTPWHFMWRFLDFMSVRIMSLEWKANNDETKTLHKITRRAEWKRESSVSSLTHRIRHQTTNIAETSHMISEYYKPNSYMWIPSSKTTLHIQ